MRLVCLSASFHHTPASLRGCLALPVDTIQPALAGHSIRQYPFETLREVAVLSTCNRLEVYAIASASSPEAENPECVFNLALNYLQGTFEFSAAEAKPYFRMLTDLQAVEHLFQVASGLDSIAIGETQILGQVTRALEMGLRAGSARHVLSSLFRAAVHTGKRVHSETQIGRHPTNLSMIGVKLAEDTLGNLEDRQILVVGAGRMARLAVETLLLRKARQITLTNRTMAHAREIANKTGIQILPYEQLGKGLVEADLVITASSAPMPVITRGMLTHILPYRSHQPLTLVDLAMPGNVEYGSKEIPGMRVFDMDDLQEYVQKTPAPELLNISQAEKIVNEELVEYQKLLRIIPFIGELHKKIEQIRQREVERMMRNLHDPQPEIIEQLELFSHSLVRKILHEPTMHLRNETDQATLNEYVDALAKLYDLTEKTGSEL